MENGPACLHLEKAVRQAIRPAMKEDESEAFLLADSLITESLRQVVWGELLVAMRWHFVGNPISGKRDGASNGESALSAKERNRVRERAIVQDAVNVKLP
jgi:hypothetical protein